MLVFIGEHSLSTHRGESFCSFLHTFFFVKLATISIRINVQNWSFYKCLAYDKHSMVALLMLMQD